MTNQIIGVETTAKGISVILTGLLSKDIQLQYSACGHETSGQKKKSFCDTMTFKCMKGIFHFLVLPHMCVCVMQFRKVVINFMADVLVEKFSVSKKEIISKTSRWFTGASDRAGGRKERNRPKERDERENEQST